MSPDTLIFPLCGLTYADVVMVSKKAHNKVEAAKMLGVSYKNMCSTFKKKGLDGMFHNGKRRKRRVTREEVDRLGREGYLKSDAAYLLGISVSYLRDLLQLWQITSFADQRSLRCRIGKKGYCR
jgi:transposase